MQSHTVTKLLADHTASGIKRKTLHTDKLEMILCILCTALHNPWQSFFIRTTQLFQQTTHLHLKAVQVVWKDDTDSFNVKEEWATTGNLWTSRLHVDGRGSPGPDVMLSLRSHSDFNLDASHLHRSTYSCEDRPPSAALINAFSSSRGPL